MSQRSGWGNTVIRRLLASKRALIIAVALAAGVAIAVPTTVYAATTPGGLLAVFTGEVPSAASEKLEGVTSDKAGDIADTPAKPTPTPEPSKDADETPKPKPTEEPKPKPTAEPKPKPTPTDEPKPKPEPDPEYQFEDPAAARAAFDAHRSGSGLPAFDTYNGNDCTKVGYAATKSPVGSPAPSAMIIAEAEWLVLSTAGEGRITTAKVNGWYDDSGRWRIDLAVYDCAA
jgi:outer membrane biosynthesis protein TonB